MQIYLHISDFFTIFAPELKKYTMKQISFELDSFYGYGCCGCSYSSEDSGQMQVDDAVAATLLQLKAALPADAKGISKDAIEDAIDEGHTELQAMHDTLMEKAKDMDARYWLFEADNECIDESLEEFFYDDVEAGLYEPVPDDIYDHDRGYEPNSFEACRHNYLEWVNSHDDDYWFIADRVGLDLAAVYENSEATYIITEIED